MFSKDKPLPAAVLTPQTRKVVRHVFEGGIHLGEGAYWNPELLPNAHICCIGASGSGKTQTLKAIAYELSQTYPVQVILIDFHGDQSIVGETEYPIHMASPHGINPLIVNPDPQGGGPGLQAISVSSALKRAVQLGPNQEGILLEVIEACYREHGIVEDDYSSWQKSPPNFAHLKAAIEERENGGCKESAKLRLKLAKVFQYGVFSREQPELEAPILRVNLSKLPMELQSVAAESLAQQLMNNHQLLGEIEGRCRGRFW